MAGQQPAAWTSHHDVLCCFGEQGGEGAGQQCKCTLVPALKREKEGLEREREAALWPATSHSAAHLPAWNTRSPPSLLCRRYSQAIQRPTRV